MSASGINPLSLQLFRKKPSIASCIISNLPTGSAKQPFPNDSRRYRCWPRRYSAARITAKVAAKSAMEFRKLGDSDLVISEITLGTMTFGEQNTEEEAHEILSYAFEHGINTLDTSEAYPIPMKKETQGQTDLYIASWLKSQPRDKDLQRVCYQLGRMERLDSCSLPKVILATKVCGYSERLAYLRQNASVLRVDAANIKESVENSLKRLGTDYIDLLQIHWPDRYVALFGDSFYDPSKWRASIPFAEQLKAFQELIKEGKKELHPKK